MLTATKCRACGEPVVFAFTASGQRQPFDEHPQPEGVFHYDEGTDYMAYSPARHGDGYRPHARFCPGGGNREFPLVG